VQTLQNLRSDFRKKMIEKRYFRDQAFFRRYPAIILTGSEAGDQILNVKKLSGCGWRGAFKDIDLNLAKAIRSSSILRIAVLLPFYDIINNKATADSGTFDWESQPFKVTFLSIICRIFDTDMNLVDWLRSMHKLKKREEVFLRGF
jgi:hypothetical protein